MKIKNFVLVAVFTVFLLSAPSSTFAYQTTSQSVIKINDNTALFLIEFDFGFLNADSWLSFMAVDTINSGSVADNLPVLDYLVEGGYKESDYTSQAMLLSRAKLNRDNNYVIEKGQKEKFTLVVLLQKTPQATGELKTTSISIDKIFHLLKLKNDISLRSLDQTLLVEHKTPTLIW